VLGRYTTGPYVDTELTRSRTQSYSGSAGVPGLEPRLAEPESAGLPITPYPIGFPARDTRAGSTGLEDSGRAAPPPNVRAPRGPDA
jgi:hypothetical protein